MQSSGAPVPRPVPRDLTTGTDDRDVWIALRPWGPLAVADASFVLLRRGGTVFVPLATVLVAVPAALSFAFTLFARSVGNAGIDPGAAWSVAVAAVDAVLAVVTFAAASLACSAAAVDVWTGAVPTVRAVLRRALSPVRWAAMTALVAVAWSPVLAAAVPSWSATAVWWQRGLWVLGVPFAVVLTLRWLRVAPVVVAENVGVGRARRRAAQLGRPLGTWRLALSLLVAGFLAALVVFAFFLAAELARGRIAIGLASPQELIIDAVFGMLGGWAVLLVCGTVPFAAYVDGRVRNDGVDITALAPSPSGPEAARAAR
jgi:hypothetical protein